MDLDIKYQGRVATTKDVEFIKKVIVNSGDGEQLFRGWRTPVKP